MLNLDKPQITRRRLLGSTASLGVGLALAACSNGTTSSLIPAEAAGAIQAIGQQVTLVMPQLVAAGLSQANATTVGSITSQIQAAATAISGASTATAGSSTLVQIEGYINALAPIVEPILEAAAGAAVPGGGFAIALIVAALPAVEFALNITVTTLTAQAQALGSKAVVPASAALGGVQLGGLAQSQQALNEMRRRAGK